MHIEKIISPPVVPHFFFNLMTNALLISCGAHQIVDKFCIFDYLLIIGGQTYFYKGIAYLHLAQKPESPQKLK